MSLVLVTEGVVGAKDTYYGKTKKGDVLVGVFVGGETPNGRAVGVVLCDPDALMTPTASTAFRPYATWFQITQTSLFNSSTAKLVTDGGSRVTAHVGKERVTGTVRMSDGRRLRFNLRAGDYAAKIGTRCGSPPTSMPPTPCGPVTNSPIADVVPVRVPCGCPSLPVAPAPTGADGIAEATATAAAYLRELQPQYWDESNTVVDNAYAITGPDAANSSFRGMFDFTATAYCDDSVAPGSFGVELHSTIPGPAGSGIRGVLVVAHFDAGWRVWGVYKGPLPTPSAS